MTRPFKPVLPRTWEQLWISCLALFDLSIILWVAITAWERPCRAAGDPGCPPLLPDLEPLLLALGFWTAGLALRVRDRRGAAKRARRSACAGRLPARRDVRAAPARAGRDGADARP